MTCLNTAIDLDELLRNFVQLHAGVKQRDPNWYASMGKTIGGSEIAAIVGKNPYSTFLQVVKSKIQILDGVDTWSGGGVACWWGTLFEDCAGAYVAADLGSPVLGDEICIQAIPGHRNSPDGYVVAKFYQAGAEHVWTTDIDLVWPKGQTDSDSDPSPQKPKNYIKKILLLEFKCPLTRKPTLEVPIQYWYQVQSGLAVSPVATLGLFADFVFRKCALPELDASGTYDTSYHVSDTNPCDGAVTWSFFAIYAPKMDAPRHVRYGWSKKEWTSGDPSTEHRDADAAHIAYNLRVSAGLYAAADADDAADAAEAADADAAEAADADNADDSTNILSDELTKNKEIDIGSFDKLLFDRVLGLINRKRFKVYQYPMCFADGRGSNLHSPEAITAAMAEAREQAPVNYEMLGVFPWKLVRAVYTFVEREPGFLDRMRPHIDRVHETVAAARASPSSADYLAALAAERSTRKRPTISDETDKMLTEMFDSCS